MISGAVLGSRMGSRNLDFQDLFFVWLWETFLSVSDSVSGSISGSFRGCFPLRSRFENIDFVLVFTVHGGSGRPEAALHGGPDSGSIFRSARHLGSAPLKHQNHHRFAKSRRESKESRDPKDTRDTRESQGEQGEQRHQRHQRP